ncbi:hypothetical protein EMCRGX_G034603 [Ephydatia muelleri]|eukprot:Em0023g497a
MGNAFRQHPGPAIYAPLKTPVTDDLLEVGLLVAFGMIGFSFLLIIPGIRSWERLWATIRVFVTLFIGASILVSNFGYGWYTDKICTRTQYKAYVNPPDSAQEIQAVVGLLIGLRGINVTLDEVDCGLGNGAYVRPFPGEKILYTEEFLWSDPWRQGRFGFGRYAGRFAQTFRADEFRGTPYPILWVAEYFTFDGEGLRWGRKFRQAGWYTHIFMWLAFALYLVSILLFIYVIRQGALFMLYMGLVLCLAVFTYGMVIMNTTKMTIPFQDGTLNPQFGWSWWLTLVTGIFSVIVSIVILVTNYIFPRQVAAFFHHTLIEEDEFFAVQEDELTASHSEQAKLQGGAFERRGLSRYRQTRKMSRGASLHRSRLHEDIPLTTVTVST